jgi:hypothetical protein
MNDLMNKWLFVLIICVLPLSCFNKDKVRLIPKKELVPLLIDLHIADAIASNGPYGDIFDNLDSISAYSWIFNKHGYSKKELEKTFEYYSKNPKKLTEIYDEVFAELSKQSEEVKAARTKYSSFNNKCIYKAQKAYIIEGDSSSYPPEFDFPIDGTGAYLLTANILMFPGDESKNPRITAYFYNPENNDPKNRHYFRETFIIKSNNSREYQIPENLNNPSLTYLHIIIPDQDRPDSVFYKKIQLLSFTVSKIIDNKQK